MTGSTLSLSIVIGPRHRFMSLLPCYRPLRAAGLVCLFSMLVLAFPIDLLSLPKHIEVSASILLQGIASLLPLSIVFIDISWRLPSRSLVRTLAATSADALSPMSHHLCSTNAAFSSFAFIEKHEHPYMARSCMQNEVRVTLAGGLAGYLALKQSMCSDSIRGKL